MYADVNRKMRKCDKKTNIHYITYKLQSIIEIP